MKFNLLINRHIQWFYIFLLWNTWVVAAWLRFYNLAYLKFLVFDEKYFVEFGHRYLTGSDFFDSHPPLGKYLIAFGIWMGDHLPLPHTYIELDGALLSPWSYRWLNALVGSLIPLVVGAIAYQLTHRYSYSVIAALFALTDGLFLVESRLSLINIYMIFFGLLGQLCLLYSNHHNIEFQPPKYHSRPGGNLSSDVPYNYDNCYIINKKHPHHWFFLLAAGINFGASAAVKWNGLGFLLSAYILWFSHGLSIGFQQYRQRKQLPNNQKIYQLIRSQIFLSPRSLVLYLVILPTLVYCLCWIPHLQLNPEYGFWQVHQEIFAYHHNLGSGDNIHTYCSAWWTWPWMIRPVLYFYQTVELSDKSTVIYAVNGMANPILSWLSIAAIGWLTYLLCQQIWLRIREPLNKNSPREIDFLYRGTPLAVWYYLIVNYLCNWLPWVLVSRCTFLYHYMSAAVFAELAIAWLIDSFLERKQRYYTQGAIILILSILLAFIFWLPLYLGLPLSPEAWQHRIWFSSWL